MKDRGFFGSMMDYIDDIRGTVVKGGKGRRRAIDEAAGDYDPAPTKADEEVEDEEKKPTKTTSLGFKARMKA